jgi:hypothetical protein
MVHALHRPLPEQKMRTRTSLVAVGAALATALGLLDGCGGIASRSGGGDGGASSGGGGAGTKPVAGSAIFGQPTVCTAHPCVDPKPVIVANVDTGYDTCAGGVLRRRAIVDCPSLLPRASTSYQYTCDDGGIPGACAKDTDCTEHPFGFCQGGGAGAIGAGNTIICFANCTCRYGGCVRDSDCGNNEICVCADPVGSCMPSSCSSGKDCQPGCDCLATYGQCQTPQDTCLTDADCFDAGFPGCLQGGLTGNSTDTTLSCGSPHAAGGGGI